MHQIMPAIATGLVLLQQLLKQTYLPGSSKPLGGGPQTITKDTSKQEYLPCWLKLRVRKKNIRTNEKLKTKNIGSSMGNTLSVYLWG